MLHVVSLFSMQGSRSLHSASQGWAQFHNVYILVPAAGTNSWPQIPNSSPAHEVHEDAQIRVELTNTIYGDTPFTLQTGECGEEGEFIQVSAFFIFSLSAFISMLCDIRSLKNTC